MVIPLIELSTRHMDLTHPRIVFGYQSFRENVNRHHGREPPIDVGRI